MIGQVKVKAGTFDLISVADNWVNRSTVDNRRNPLLQYLIQGLSPSTYYQVEVLASNDMGKSQPPPGKPFVFLTAEGTSQMLAVSHVLKFEMSNISQHLDL